MGERGEDWSRKYTSTDSRKENAAFPFFEASTTRSVLAEDTRSHRRLEASASWTRLGSVLQPLRKGDVAPLVATEGDCVITGTTWKGLARLVLACRRVSRQHKLA